MSEEDRLELKKELSVYSKEELIEKYIDELEENSILTNQWYKSSQKINNAIDYIEKYADENFTCVEDTEVWDTEIKDLYEILKGNDKE